MYVSICVNECVCSCVCVCVCMCACVIVCVCVCVFTGLEKLSASEISFDGAEMAVNL